ncbi:MAG TPA: dihydroorotate dehydrogenase electron transfer subunit [Actinomycetota bacterium]|nr:dihydroorotate dehydrogenase electron transfer subunit [Actinomycetota bacterium]
MIQRGMIQYTGEVLSHRKHGEEYHSLTIVAPEIAESARPGQFVNLRPPPDRYYTLRRPFSICRVNRGSGWAATVEVIFDIRGPGTAALAAMRAHDPIDIIGPVGQGFAIPKTRQTCLMVGGGVGATPLFFLGEELRAAGKRVDVLCGASRASRLVNTLELKRLGAQTEFTTDDGSVGYKGPVTDLLASMIERCGSEVIYACGPRPMLKAVTQIAVEHRVPVQVAMEEHMACGIGICMSCVAPIFNTKGTGIMLLRTCLEGPVFNGARVAWDRYGTDLDEWEAPPGN